MSISKTANKILGKTVNLVTNAVSQTSAKKSKVKYPEIDGLTEACRRAAAESFVLLKNDGAILPVTENNVVSLFGRVQRDSFYVGYGSGGDVNAHHTVSILDGIRKNKKIRLNEDRAETYRTWCKDNPVDNGYWGHWPTCYEEMHVSEALAKKAAHGSDTAIVFIGRAAGEDRENTLTKGSFYLTEEEENMLRCVSKYFSRTAVILNIGNIIDFSWVEKYDIPCVGICWQGGMETGNAVADIISGKVSPSGKLTDTIARAYQAYPTAGNFGGRAKNHYEEDIFVGYRYFETFDKDAVLFPFGHGLSYGSFVLDAQQFSETQTGADLSLRVKNLSELSAKETVQIYYSVENAALPVPAMQLAAFYKTQELGFMQEGDIRFHIKKSALACYDDAGTTGYKNAWVLVKGTYRFYAGFSVRKNVQVGSFEVKENVLIRQCGEICAPKAAERLLRLRPFAAENGVCRTFEAAPTAKKDLREEILNHLPAELPENTDRSSTLFDVQDGNLTLEQFTASLNNDELEAISRGDYIMNSPLGPTGNAGVLGGVTESLRARHVLPVTCTDGPSGIRLAASSALLPSGTALACTMDPELIREVYSLLGAEMADRGSDILLAPGMNIHRDPLCGRNFEYFSEDPLITGRAAAAVVKGLHDAGVSGCPKHFACNNQETNRTKNDSVVSQRALREIYWKGFEICVKTAAPKAIMTSYNKVNGVWSHYNYEMVTELLRGEWGYKGLVMTDWWMQKSASPEFPALRDQAYRVRAGVDVLMPGGERVGKKRPDGTLLETLGKENGITRGELQATALHVLRFILQSRALVKARNENTVTVMSFNVLCAGDGENEWQKRIPRVIRAIRSASPDLFCLQEAHQGWMDAVTEYQQTYDFVGVGRDNGKKKGEYAAVFYKKSRFSKLDEGSFWLSEKPEKPGKGWDADCIRICSWVKLEEKESGKQFVCMNTHLDHIGRLAMLNGASLIAQRAAGIAGGLPVVLTGDFNVTPDSEPYKAILDGGFTDARELAACTDRTKTYHGYSGSADGISQIDHIFVKGDIKALELRVDRKKYDGRFPSDHFPVIAELVI